MKRMAGIAALAVLLASAVATAQQTPALSTQKDKNSYALGVNIGTGLKQQGFEISPEMLAKGVADAYSGGKALMTEQEVRDTLAAVQKEIVAKMQEKQKAAGDKNKAAGEAFMAANTSKEGVKTTTSGLQYKVVKAGTGPKPTADDTVSVHYRGTLTDGTEFDSSYSRKEPATFPVKGVIAGWTEILQLMPVGSTWQVVIPANLAYGERGAGGKIGPNATLVFEIELLSIKSKDAEATK
ncbi:MAG: FKBP-type peptidyl-prolyl cis-trans isomerase [Acidobacteriota bacterium]